jgi:hypothetical protein
MGWSMDWGPAHKSSAPPTAAAVPSTLRKRTLIHPRSVSCTGDIILPGFCGFCIRKTKKMRISTGAHTAPRRFKPNRNSRRMPRWSDRAGPAGPRRNRRDRTGGTGRSPWRVLHGADRPLQLRCNELRGSVQTTMRCCSWPIAARPGLRPPFRPNVPHRAASATRRTIR